MRIRRAAGFLALTCVAASPAPAPKLVLTATGLVIGGKPVRFDAPRAAVVAAVSALRGKPVKTHTVPDCGQGEAITDVTWKGQFSLSFIAGKFSGWTLDAADPALRTAKGIGVGAPWATVKAAYPGTSIDEDEVGDHANLEDGLRATMSSRKAGAKVLGLVGGSTCIVGV